MLLLAAVGALGATLWKIGPSRTSDTNPGAELVHGPSGLREIALTFDLGGELGSVGETMAALRATGTQATIFITGEWAQQHPQWVRQIAAGQHEIGNHTWSHPDLTKLSDAAIQHELLTTEKLLQSLTAQPIKPLWRAPFGERNSRVLSVAAAANWRSIYWSLDSLDSVGPAKSAEFLRQRILGQTDATLDGAIVLMHASEPATAEALPDILQGLQRRGFRCVRIGEWLRKR